MNKHMKKLFIWDFHGTLEKDNIYAVKAIIDRTLKAFNINREISLNETIKNYGLSWIDYFHFVYPQGNIKVWRQMKEKAEEIQKEQHLVEKYIKPADKAKEVLEKIQKNGHKNIILSNSAPQWIKRFVKMVKLEKYVDEIFGLNLHNLSRKGKDISDKKYEALQKYINNNKFDKLIKIGDRDSDIKAGKMLGATTYYIKNKFNQDNKLEIKPDYTISDLREVLKEV